MNHLWKVDDREKKHLTLQELNTLIEEQQKYPDEKWALSRPNGQAIQGQPEDLLEQSSTLAEPRIIRFSDGIARSIPSCYYEFARRYEDPATHQLYQGFVTKNADTLFQSTDALQQK